MTASTSTSSLPVANVQNQEPTKVWRSTALPAHVDINLGSAKAVNAAAMSGFSLTQSGLWRLRAYAAAAAADIGGTAALDSGWRSVWPDNYKHGAPEWGPEVALLRLRNDAVYQYWRVEFADTGSTYIDVGRLAIGRASQFGINMDIEAGIALLRVGLLAQYDLDEGRRLGANIVGLAPDALGRPIGMASVARRHVVAHGRVLAVR